MELRDIQKEIEKAQGRLSDAFSFLRIDEKRDELVALDEQTARPDFWNDAAAAQAVSKKAAGLRATIEDYERACGLLDDAAAACELAGDRSRIDLLTRYHARRKDVLDMNHVVRQRGRNTRAEVHESGALDDAARKSLRATIDLAHGARGSKGNESESVLVLGDDVVNKTMPVILCDEDDVQGNHGATIGSVDPQQMDYLMGRGLSREQAQDLFVRALFDDALIEAAHPLARKAVFERAAATLGQEVARDLIDTLGIELPANAEPTAPTTREDASNA